MTGCRVSDAACRARGARHPFNHLFLFICIGVIRLHAQEPPLIRGASSDLVVLSATVTDSDGGFVAAVPRDGFAIFHNGKRQPIALFSSEDSPVSVGLVIDNSASMRPKTGEVIAAT